MRVSYWFRSLTSRLSRVRQRRPRPRPVFRPRVEGLEDRLTPSGGLLDPTFGSGGIVNLPSTTDNGAPAVAVQPDGKVVIAGRGTGNRGATSISVQRLNRTGSLDTTFNQTGSVTIQTGKSDWPTSVALQPDGKILVGGQATASNGTSQFLVARLNANGTLDTTFGTKGLWLSPGRQVTKLAVLTDPAHPTTVTGIVADAQGTANGVVCFEAIKLTPAGVPDKTFGSGGFAVFANLGGSGAVGSVAADRLSGEIYLAGTVSVTLADGSHTPSGCLAALTPAGALDPAFGGGAGYVLADPAWGQESEFYDVALQTLSVNGQPVQRLVVAGDAVIATGQAVGLVAGYTVGGALDTTFGAGGSFTTAGVPGISESLFTSLALEADGSIAVGGYDYYTTADGSSHTEMLAGHLTAVGAADTTFGPGGTGFTTVRDGTDSRVWGLAIDPTDGDIVLSGYSSTPNATRQAAVVRLTAP
jgi:uncharacterized delta-60 repeat protein